MFVASDVALQFVASVRSVVETVARSDANLADQLRRAVTSAAFTAGWRGRPVLVISGHATVGVAVDAIKRASLSTMIERAKADGFWDEEEAKRGVQPVRAGFINAVQVYPFTPGALGALATGAAVALPRAPSSSQPSINKIGRGPLREPSRGSSWSACPGRCSAISGGVASLSGATQKTIMRRSGSRRPKAFSPTIAARPAATGCTSIAMVCNCAR